MRASLPCVFVLIQLQPLSSCDLPLPYSAWSPTAARSADNFNPFEKNEDGNSCDTSGYYPGEGKYSDPIRPDTSYAIMQAEAAIMGEINSLPPKAGQPGVGNYQGFNKM